MTEPIKAEIIFLGFQNHHIMYMYIIEMHMISEVMVKVFCVIQLFSATSHHCDDASLLRLSTFELQAYKVAVSVSISMLTFLRL